MKLVKACIAMAAFAAIFVVPSIASAIQLTHPTGTTPPVGTLIQATNVEHSGTGKPTVLTVGGLQSIVCQTATLTGSLTKNDNGAAVEGEITTAEFRGTKANPHGAADCDGPNNTLVQITPNHTTNPCHTPTGGSSHCSLPWCVKAGAEDILTVRGGKCSEAARPITFAYHVTGLGSCSYSDEGKDGVKATYTTHPNPAIATVKDDPFERTTGSALICPATGTLDMAFTLETDGASPTDVYID